MTARGKRRVAFRHLSSKRVRVTLPKRALRGATAAKRHKRKLRVRVSMGKAHTTLRVRVR